MSTDPLFVKEAGQYYFYHTDHLGTPHKLTAVNGAVVWSAMYSSFGQAQVLPSSTVENNFRFAGQYYDQETGLHYNYHRFYDPTIGRYLRADPIGIKGGINLFGYANTNPINVMDPLGLDWIDDFEDGIEGHGPWTEPIDPTIIDDTINETITAFSDAYNKCVHCAVECTLGVALPSELTSAVLRDILIKRAKGLAKASLKKAVPYYNVVDTIVVTGLMAECVISCQSKQ